MWLSILMTILSSDMTKQLIALGVKKLLEHKEDGITKDLSIVLLDGVAQSRANDAPSDAFEAIKKAL